MPFTPLHFGPGAIVKATLRNHFSFTIFAFTNVVIDIEPLYYMLRHEWPIHRFFHTYVGATLIAGLCAWIGRPICAVCINSWNRKLNQQQAKYLSIEPTITKRAVILSAFIGSYSHVMLDSIMHTDIKPLAPFSDQNRLLELISIDRLNLFCLMAGFIGIALILVIRLKRK